MKYCKNGEVRFNLVKKGKSEFAQIWMIFSFDGKRVRYYTGKRVKPAHWDPEKQRVKSQAEGAFKANDFLGKKARIVQDAYTDAKILGENPSVSYLQKKLKGEDDAKPTTTFEKEFEKFIDLNKKSKSPNTIKQYQNTLNHLTKFSEKKKFPLDFDSLNTDFFDAFTSYLLYDVGHFNNSVHKVIKTLKVFLEFSSETGTNTKYSYKKFRFPEKEGEIIFLTWEELMKLYEKEIADPVLSKVRDVFCFECFTSLRYSDIEKLTRGNIVDDFIQVNVTKKREKKILTIPLIPQAREIIEKYSETGDKKLLPVMSNQKMNSYLKELGELAEINSPVIIVKYKGPERTEEIVPKYKVLTTHVGRKTFITNFLAKGVSAQVLMSITDHKSDRPFRRYYKIMDDNKKKEILKALQNEG